MDAGLDHSFYKPTGDELIYDHKRYLPNAVVGMACGYSMGRIPQPHEFSGGEALGQASYVLRSLGFTFVEQAVDESEPQAGQNCSAREVRHVVADYFEMLESELLGVQYRKTEHRQALIPQLSGRSDGSVGVKYQNVSGVLAELGLPYIEGYEPRSNYPAILATEVETCLDQRPDFFLRLAAVPTFSPLQSHAAPASNLAQILEDPPSKVFPPRPLKSRVSPEMHGESISRNWMLLTEGWAKWEKSSASSRSGIACCSPGVMIWRNKLVWASEISEMGWVSTSSRLTRRTTPRECSE